MAIDAGRAANNAANYLVAGGIAPVTDKPKLVTYLTEIFQGLIDEIHANAVVEVTNVTGVVSGGSSSGPGTGTIV